MIPSFISINMKVTEKQADPTGLETLDVIAKANQFNLWMYSSITPYCQGNILEVGSGIGNISEYFLKNNSSIFLSDFRSEYCDNLRNNFGSFPTLLGVEQIDLVSESFDFSYSHLFNKFDTVFALNVLEHIQDHDQAIQNSKKLLKTGGRLIILVPAYPNLFCRFDEELGHYRRYTRKSLSQVIKINGFDIYKKFNFNLAGIAGWLLFGKISKRKQIEQNEMGIFNRLVPVFKLLDIISFRAIGLSIIIIATKSDQ